MDAAHSSPARYAVLRVDKRKAKAQGAIAAASAHQLRQRHTPNADAKGPAPLVLHLAAGATPYQAAQSLLDGAERRNRTTVLAREIVLSASPGYFRPGREQHGGEFLAERVKTWASAALAWAKRTWPDQLASFVVHLDEMTPHAHCLVVPRERKPDGGWRLNSKGFFDRERLRELQTGYGAALAPLGLRRGEPGSRAKHAEVKQFYGALNKAAPLERPSPPKPPTAPKASDSTLRNALEPIAGKLGIETTASREKQRYAEKRRAWVAQMKQFRAEEEERWEHLRAIAAVQPLRERSAPAPVPASAVPLTVEKPRQAPRKHLGPR